MITEEMLTTAAAEVSDAMVSSIPDRTHRFSAGFERKLRSLTRRAEHPVRYRLMRQAAAVLIAVFTAFAMLYAASPTVRAMATNWIRDIFGSYVQYSPLDTTSPDVMYDYYLPDEFNGYKLKEVIDRGDDMFYVYYNEEGDMLCFDYIHGSSSSYMYLTDIENHQYTRSSVHSHPADIYIAPDGDQASVIFWQIVEENALLCISAKEDMNQLIAIAEKVEKIPKN